MIGHRKLSENHSLMRLIIIGIIIFGIMTLIYWGTPIEITPKMSTYIQMLTVLIFVINGIVTVKTFRNQNEDRVRNLGIQYANLKQNKSSEIEKLFLSNPNLDRLYFQMYSHDPHIQKIQKMRGQIKETIEILKAEHHAAGLIFQKMADIYACEKLDEFNDDTIEWINTFRSWMKSSILRSHWRYLKYEQHPQFRDFVEISLIKNNKFISKLINSLSNFPIKN